MNSPLLWGSARAHTNIPWLFWRKFTLLGFKRLSLVFLVLALALAFWRSTVVGWLNWITEAKSSESGWRQDSLPGCDRHVCHDHDGASSSIDEVPIPCRSQHNEHRSVQNQGRNECRDLILYLLKKKDFWIYIKISIYIIKYLSI